MFRLHSDLRHGLRYGSIATLLLTLSIGTAPSARANDEATAYGGYWGVMVGAAVPSGSATNGTGSRLGYGADIGFRPLPLLGLGAYFMRSSGSVANSNADFNVSFYGVEGIFFLPLTGINVGARVGSTSVTNKDGPISVTTNPFAFGPRIGYELSLPFVPLALGIEYNPMIVASSEDGAIKRDGFQIHNFYGTARFSF